MQLSRSLPSKVLSEYLLCAKEGARHCGMNSLCAQRVWGYLIFTFHKTTNAQLAYYILFHHIVCILNSYCREKRESSWRDRKGEALCYMEDRFYCNPQEMQVFF